MLLINTISIYQQDNGDIAVVSNRPARIVTFIHATDGTPSVDTHELARVMFDALDSYSDDEKGQPGPGQNVIPGLSAEDAAAIAGGYAVRVSHGYDTDEAV